ncbi:MAG: aldo/keto reductase [Nitrososphaerales archaeon]
MEVDPLLSIDSKVELNNGIMTPRLGLGTWAGTSAPSRGSTKKAVLYALGIGYRHIDTAMIYGNEAEVGEAVRESGLNRDKVFVTTKLWNGDQGYDTVFEACEKSLGRLGFSYLDLYLIHWPVEQRRLGSWKALEKLLAEGKCRAIGVSNFTESHLQELIENSSTIPSVNQIEFSPYLYQKNLLDFCRSHGIWVEAYSPLTRGKKLGDTMLIEIGQKNHKTSAQILIRWALQKNMIVLPKSFELTRIEENSKVYDFEIDDHDMNVLDSMNQNLRNSWNPYASEDVRSFSSF